MGQGHSKRHKSRRYQLGEQPVPVQPTGNQRKFIRKKQNVSKHLAQHSHELAHHSQYVEHQNQLMMQYKRRSSQEYVPAQMDIEARPRAMSWHESRFQPLPDVGSRMTGNYRPNLPHSTRKETSLYFASPDEDNVTSMGYYSMDRRESYYSQKDSSFAPPSTRRERSEVTEHEITQLVEELRDTDWMRLGSHLGISTSRLGAFRDRYLGNVPLCSTEVLLLWKNNCSEVVNPRSHLALALSTIGREDLYIKIKQRTYLNTTSSRESQNKGLHELPQNTELILNESDHQLTINEERSLDRTESGVETIESLSDSLEEESDDDDDTEGTGWENENQVINVPVTMSKENTSDHKPKSITVPVIRASSPVHSSPPPSHIPPVNSNGDTDQESALKLAPSSAVKDQLDEDAGTVLTQLESTESVSFAVLKSQDGSIQNPAEDAPSMENIRTEKVTSNERPNHDITPTEGLQVNPSSGSKRIPESTTPLKQVDMGRSLNNESQAKYKTTERGWQPGFVARNSSKTNGTTENDKPEPKIHKEASQRGDVGNNGFTEDELRMLSVEFNSEAEWRMLGKRLGLSQTEINSLPQTPGEGAAECAFAILKLWKRRFRNLSKERQILAGVTSDLGRDDMYSAIMKNKLVNRMQMLNASLERWQSVLKQRYSEDEKAFWEIDHYMDIPMFVRDEDDVINKIQTRHDIMKVQRNSKHPSLIVIHGDAGCGKTTVLRRLAKDWVEEKEESYLSKVPLAFLLTLQELRGCKSIGEAVVRHLLFSDALTTAGMVDDYLKLNPEGAMLLLDGFDVSRSDGDLRFIQEMCNHVQCQLVITSRTDIPRDEDSPNNFISVEIQDLGGDLRSKFITSYFDPNFSRGKELLVYLQSDDVLSSFSCRPMFLATLCRLWKNSAPLQDINTLSDVITSALVLQFIGHEDVLNVVEGVSRAMSALSRVALNTIMQPTPRLSFKTVELASDSERECAELAERVGLIRSSNSTLDASTIAKEDREWYFSHPLVHEKCAAIGLANLFQSDPDRFEDIILSIASVGQCYSLRYIMMFTCGESTDSARRILRLLSDLTWKDSSSKLVAQELALKCNFECHRNDILNTELQINLRSMGITCFTSIFMADVSFRYFILNSVRESSNPLQTQKVQFMISSRADMEYATACLQNGYFTAVPEFMFEMPRTFSPSREASRRLSDDVITPSLRSLTVSSILSTSDFISNLHASEHLEELRGSDIDPKYVDVASWCRNYPNLKNLRLTCTMYQDPSNVDNHRNRLKALGDILCTLNSLKHLNLSNFFSSERALQIVTKALQTLPDLCSIQLGPSGEQLHHYSEEVEETCGEVTEATIQSFIKATKKSSSLRVLQLSCFGNFEKLFQLLRSETTGRRGSELNYTSPGNESGFWLFQR